MINLGWYELMDRVIMIQDQLETNVAEHKEVDEYFYKLIQDAQEKLSDAYQYAGEKFINSYEDGGKNV